MRSNVTGKLKFILLIILSLTITVTISDKFFDAGVKVEFDVFSEMPIEYQFFADEGQDFCEEKSIHVAGKKRKEYEHIEAIIVSNNVNNIRVDFGADNNSVMIKNFKINSEPIDLHDLFVNANQIEVINVKDGEAKFRTIAPDPFVVIHQYKSGGQYEWLYVISVFFLSIIILYPVIFYIEKIMTGNKERAIEAAFLVIVFAICVVPVVHINKEDVDKRENRMLAKRPQLWVNGKINEKYGKQMENYLNDRFNGRNSYIKIHDKINDALLGDDYDGRKAFSGKDNWLFFKDDYSVELYQHRMPFTDNELGVIKTRLERQTMWFKEHGIYYSIMLAPNKADVYGEFYREDVHQKNTQDRVQLLLVHMGGTDVNIIYPLDRIREHKKDGLLYWKTDTHWNPLGAYWGYWDWMQDLKKHIPDIEPITLAEMDLIETRHTKGDLSNMLKIEDTRRWEDDVYYDLVKKNGWDYTLQVEEIHGDGSTPNIIHTINPGKKHKVVMFRDSFAKSMVPYIASTFGEVYFMWNRDYDKYTDLILGSNVDIVLNEFVSRRADQLLKEASRWEAVQ